MYYRVTINSPLAVPDFIRYLENDFEGPNLSTESAIPIHRYFAGSIALHQTASSDIDAYADVFDFGSRLLIRSYHSTEWRPNLNAGSTMAPWLRTAYGEVGVSEVRGSRHNARILDYHAAAGRAQTDEIPWCASFVNWCLEQAGINGTSSAWSLSFLNWVNGRTINEPVYGCIAVIDNGNHRGHVGFVVGTATSNPSHYVLLGGNQSNSVRLSHERRAISRFVLPTNYSSPMFDNFLFAQETSGPALNFRNTR